jgi:hypothetical protein
MSGYSFQRDEFPELLLRSFYPERTDKESAVIRDYLLAHLAEFDRVDFSVRVGQGQTPDPTHLPGVQANAVNSSKKRIDIVGQQGSTTVLIEAKTRVTHAVLGQLLTDRQLWLEDHPDAKDPRLVAIGRTSDPDTLRVLSAHGIDVYLYEGGA